MAPLTTPSWPSSAAICKSMVTPSRTSSRHQASAADPALRVRRRRPLEGEPRRSYGRVPSLSRLVFPGAVLDLDHHASTCIEPEVVVGRHVEHAVRTGQLLDLLQRVAQRRAELLR